MSGKVKHTCIHKCIIDISSFQEGLNNSCCSTGCYFQNKVVESSHKMQICFFLTFRHFFAKCTFLKLQQFFLLSTNPDNSILSTVLRMDTIVSLHLWQPLLRRQVPSTQICNLSILTIH